MGPTDRATAALTYLLDTTLLIDHALGNADAPSVVARLFASGEVLLTCDMVVAEALSKGTDDEVAVIGRLVDVLDYVATTPTAARWAGSQRRQGKVTSSRALADALIAGVAMDLDATVVTRNPRDLERLGARVLAYGE